MLEGRQKNRMQFLAGLRAHARIHLTWLHPPFVRNASMPSMPLSAREGRTVRGAHGYPHGRCAQDQSIGSHGRAIPVSRIRRFSVRLQRVVPAIRNNRLVVSQNGRFAARYWRVGHVVAAEVSAILASGVPKTNVLAGMVSRHHPIVDAPRTYDGTFDASYVVTGGGATRNCVPK